MRRDQLQAVQDAANLLFAFQADTGVRIDGDLEGNLRLTDDDGEIANLIWGHDDLMISARPE